MTYVLLVSGLSLAILGLLVWRAPRGWQDENGFHLGEEPYAKIEELPVTPAEVISVEPVKRRTAPRRKAA